MEGIAAMSWANGVRMSVRMRARVCSCVPTGGERYLEAAQRLWRHLGSPAGQASCWQGLLPAWWSVVNGRWAAGVLAVMALKAPAKQVCFGCNAITAAFGLYCERGMVQCCCSRCRAVIACMQLHPRWACQHRWQSGPLVDHSGRTG